MDLVNLLFAVVLAQILVILPMYLIVVRRKVSFRNHLRWKSIVIDTDKPSSEIINDLRTLFQNKLIINLTITKDQASFQDKTSFVSWGNIYLLKLDGDSPQLTIYYRGALLPFVRDSFSALSLSSVLGLNRSVT